MQNVQVLTLAVAIEGGKAEASRTCPLRDGVLGKDNNPKFLEVRSNRK